MLYGNVEKLDLVPYVESRVQRFIMDAMEVARENESGRFELQDGAFVLLVTAETEPAKLRQAEFHKQYVDIQILLSGEETIGFSNSLDSDSQAIPNLPKDVAFIDDVNNEQFISLNGGDFVIFFPNQPHRPLCSTQQPMVIRKAIVKIPAKLLC